MRYARRVLWGWVGTSVLAGAVLGPSTGLAQDPEWGVHRAVKMEAQARSLADERDEWKHAAWLFEQAASLRPVGDPEAVVDLHWAGRLAYYVGDLKGSLRALEGAGVRAMEGGDVLTAGNLLVDAAWVASKLGRNETVSKLIRRAERTVAVSVLSDDVRNTVLSRIDVHGSAVTVAADFAADMEDFGPGQ